MLDSIMRKLINLAALLQQATPSPGACMTRLARSPQLLAYGGTEGALRRIRTQGQEEALLRPRFAQPWVRTLAHEAEAMIRCRLSAQQIAQLITPQVGLLVSRFAPMTLECDPGRRILAIVHAGHRISEILLEPARERSRGH